MTLRTENPVEYSAWSGMRQRVKAGPEYKRYGTYGARGIKVCKRWDKFENFLKDMGKRPSKKHSLDRINNAKGYYPSNCRWATYTEQNSNMRHTLIVTVRGVTFQSMIAAKRAMGTDPETIMNCIKRKEPGFSIKRKYPKESFYAKRGY